MANKHKSSEFHFYFATDPAEYKRYERLLKSANLLVSVAYLKSVRDFDTFVDKMKKHKGRVILDSGAFTNFEKPGFVKFEEWAEFVKAHSGWLTEYIQFDDLKSRSKTMSSFEKAVGLGLKPLFVDQLQFSHSTKVEPIWKAQDKVCLAGFVASRVGGLRMDRFKAAIDRAESHDTFVHCLGIGSMRRFLPMIKRIHSIDSASWDRASSFGGYLAFRYDKIEGIKIPVLTTYSAPGAKTQGKPPPPDVKKRTWDAVVAANGLSKEKEAATNHMVCIINTKRYIEAVQRFDPAQLIEALSKKDGDKIQKMLDDESLAEHEVAKFDPRDESSPDIGWTVGAGSIEKAMPADTPPAERLAILVKAEKQEPKKLENERAKLRKALEANRGERCGFCQYFRKPNGCTIVEGPVGKDQVCDWIQSRAIKGTRRFLCDLYRRL